nr:hypothetical protein [uncultured Azospirillum sp.]
MARYTVTKPFNTATRRFAVGQQVNDADLDGTLTMQDRVDLGQIEKTEDPVTKEEEPVVETEEPAVETDHSAAVTEPQNDADTDPQDEVIAG